MPRCKHCLIKFEIKRFNQKFCEKTEECMDASIKFVIDNNRRLAEKKKADEWKEEKKVMVENIKTLPEYKKDLELEINAIVRLLDRGHDCISGGFEWGKYKVHAGHLYSVGSSPSIRFHLLNIFGQSEHDNLHLHGNGAIYLERIKVVFGKEVFDEISDLRHAYPVLKANVSEIKEATVIARQIKKSLIKMDTFFEIEERINLRKTYNKMIGLYL